MLESTTLDYVLERSNYHHIQRAIVHKLLPVESARFSELKPKEMESNIFMYHLKQLISLGIVEKTEGGYALTSAGKHFVDRANIESLKIRIQPKLITIITLQRQDGKWLILERLHQPFLNFKGFPSGKVHYGETLQEAANRELKEKGNIVADLSMRGTFVMRYSSEGEIVNHIIGYVFGGKVPANTTAENSNEHYRSYWGDESDLFAEKNFKGHKEILDLLKKYKPGELFMSQIDFESDF